jgi:hypothetical protein
MLKCPRCSQKAYMTKTNMGDKITETICCSYCFYDEAKVLQEKEKQEKKEASKNTLNLASLLFDIKKKLNSCDNKTDQIKRFEKVINDFEKGI